MRRNTIALLFVMVASISGCHSARPWPFAPQGTVAHQQSDAIVHDPYPLNDIAPEDASMRPREFRSPLPEPVRNKIVPSTQIWTGQ